MDAGGGSYRININKCSLLKRARSYVGRCGMLGAGGQKRYLYNRGGGRRDRSIVLLRRRFGLNSWHGGEEALADLLTLILRLDVPGEKNEKIIGQ